MRVPKRYLPRVAGGLWLAVGLGLTVRGLLWWRPWLSAQEALLALALLPLAVLFSSKILLRVARRTLSHIRNLPEKACLFAFQPPRSWLIMGSMILLGILLRRSPLSRDLLGGLYVLMGLALSLTGPRFWILN